MVDLSEMCRGLILLLKLGDKREDLALFLSSILISKAKSND